MGKTLCVHNKWLNFKYLVYKILKNPVKSAVLRTSVQ